MPKYKAPTGVANISVGGENFNVEADGCITVPNQNYHSLLAPLGYELQPEAAPAPVKQKAATPA